MRQKNFLLGLILMISLLISSTVFAGAQDFELVNGTNDVISYVYVSPSNAADWQEDVLNTGVLGIGDSVNITFPNGEKAKYWDVKVVFDNGSERYWEGFDLKSISSIKIKADGSASYR